MWRIYIIGLACLFFLCSSRSAIAKESNQFINIVNPVRISSYTEDIAASLTAQYQETDKYHLRATWLLTPQVLNHAEAIKTIKTFDPKSEIGLFLEVVPETASQAGVTYHQSDSWHRASALFLTGYTQADRKKLIDKAFASFNDQFGFYPKSVGAWWIDSYSLIYMQSKYGISAYMGCADQYSTDSYQLWGQPWSIPYYPSKEHSGMPSNNLNQKISIVKLQWAPRDPINGYGPDRASLYSSQDYFTIKLSDQYYRDILELYAGKHNNSFGQVTVGLEADFSAEGYKTGPYHRWMEQIDQLVRNGDYQTVTMNEFAQFYQQQFPELSPSNIIESQDLLGQNEIAYWYQSPLYRVYLHYDQLKQQTEIRDFRNYLNNFQEPYYLTPNSGLDLLINIPATVDSVTNPQSTWVINQTALIKTTKSEENLRLYFADGMNISLTPQQITFDQQVPADLALLEKFNSVQNTSNQLIIKPRAEMITPSSGWIKQELTPELPYFFQRKRGQLAILALIAAIGFMTLILLIFKRKIIWLFLKIVGSLLIGVILCWILVGKNKFFISQSEVLALDYLATLPPGKVIVYGKACGVCDSFQTPFKPAAMANKRGYVETIGRHPIVYENQIFTAVSPQIGKPLLDRLKAKYLYLANYGDYIEKLPFPDGDYKLKKIYQNANAQIWQIE